MDRRYFRTSKDQSEQAWAPTIPLVILEYCLCSERRSKGKSLLITWLGLHWLIEAFPHRKGFNRREIATRACVSETRVYEYIAELVQQGFVNEVWRGRTCNFAAETPIYSIPLRQLITRSSDMLPDVLATWKPLLPSPTIPDEQIRLDFDHTSAMGSPDPSMGSTDPPMGSTDPPMGSTDPGHGIYRSHGDAQADHNDHSSSDHMEGKGREDKGRESPPPPLIAGSSGGPPPSSARPPRETVAIALIEEALGRPLTRLETKKVLHLVDKHDQPTGAYAGGQGEHWLEQAIVEAAFVDTFGTTPKWFGHINSILRRWRMRTTDSYNAYGSDLPPDERKTNSYEQRRSSADRRPGADRRAAPDNGREARPTVEIIGLPAPAADR